MNGPAGKPPTGASRYRKDSLNYAMDGSARPGLDFRALRFAHKCVDTEIVKAAEFLRKVGNLPGRGMSPLPGTPRTARVATAP
jgi:hypothetical protein